MNKVIVMYNGKIVLQGPPREVLYNYEALLKSRITPPHIVQLVKELSLGNKIRPLNIDELLYLMNTVVYRNV